MHDFSGWFAVGSLPDHVAPAVGHVAALALHAAGFEVDVVLAMTADAVDRQHDLLRRRLCMTGQAFHLDVLVDQFEAGSKIVVEVPILPAARAVALVAARAQALLVKVILCMTGCAFAPGVLEGRAVMALLAVEPGMTVAQRERRTIVIE